MDHEQRDEQPTLSAKTRTVYQCIQDICLSTHPSMSIPDAGRNRDRAVKKTNQILGNAPLYPSTTAVNNRLAMAVSGGSLRSPSL